MERIKLFESPSGRLHAQKTCSGGPGPLHMMQTRRTAAELQQLWDASVALHQDPSKAICKCAWSKVPDKEVK